MKKKNKWHITDRVNRFEAQSQSSLNIFEKKRPNHIDEMLKRMVLAGLEILQSNPITLDGNEQDVA